MCVCCGFEVLVVEEGEIMDVVLVEWEFILRIFFNIVVCNYSGFVVVCKWNGVRVGDDVVIRL